MIQEGDDHLEQAKKRDHKILITEIAIEKVPYIEIPTFTPEQNQKLQQVNREILHASMIYNNSNEIACIYNYVTNEKTFVSGDESHVDIDGDLNVKLLQNKSYALELVVAHNHPSTANFSFADIDYFIANEYIGLMSAVTNQGEAYIMHKTKAYNYNEARQLEIDLIKEFSLSEQTEMASEFLKRCQKGGILYAKGK